MRWEPTHLGLGPSSASSGALVAIDASQRPLLSFLLRYATGTQDLTLLSEIYWSLWCLSEDALDPERITYDKARWVLIKSLAGSIEFWDGARGTRLDNLCLDLCSSDHGFLEGSQAWHIFKLYSSGQSSHSSAVTDSINSAVGKARGGLLFSQGQLTPHASWPLP